MSYVSSLTISSLRFNAIRCILEQSYSTAHKEMKKAEHDRGLPDVQQGGSSHGIAEIVYRQHACRLKALLVAVQHPKETRDSAEREALRITRAHWFSNPGDGAAYDPEKDVRDSVWEVLADCVSAMAQLRSENHFFHRSVYRHAMALLWAPVLYDPERGYAHGSLGNVPATKSYHLRGLNTGEGACAKSAAAVISALFDKKRLVLPRQRHLVYTMLLLPPFPWSALILCFPVLIFVTVIWNQATALLCMGCHYRESIFFRSVERRRPQI